MANGGWKKEERPQGKGSFPTLSAPKSVKLPVVTDEQDEKHHAACTGNVQWLQNCLQKSENPTQADINGFSALHSAALYGRLDCIKMLVEKYGVSVDLASVSGWRPIHLVMNKESGSRALECLMYLISKEADVNIQNQHGVSPLHRAASEGRTDCVKALIAVGADVHAKDHDGQEPIDLCRMWAHRECARYLSSAMWKIDKQNFAREIMRLDELKKECQRKEEEFLRQKQMELSICNDIVFSEWLAKKHLAPPSPRILNLLEMWDRPVTPRKRQRVSGSKEAHLFESLKMDRRQRPWNISPNPASVPVTCIFPHHTVRLGISPEESLDHDFSRFLILAENGYGKPAILVRNFGRISPIPILPYKTIERSLYPHTRPARLQVPQGLKPQHVWDIQSKRPPSPARRWTDQMAMSLRQTLDPTFLAALKAHLATYTDAEVLLPKQESGSGSSSREPSSLSFQNSRLD